MTAKVITWLGEDIEDDQGNVSAGPSFLTWGGIRFDKDKGVLLDDQTGDPAFREMKAHILMTTPGSPFYKIDDVHPEQHKHAKEPVSPTAPKPSGRPGTRK